MEKSKKPILQVLICVGLLCLIWGTYIPIARSFEKKNEEPKILNLPVITDHTILTDVEDVKIKDGKVVLNGWGLRLNTKNSAIHLVLQPTDGSTGQVLSPRCTDREDICDYFAPDWEFGKVGFSANVKESALQKDICYEILLTISYEETVEFEGKEYGMERRRKITTGQYLYEGNLYRYNPKEFERPDITEPGLVQVMDEGILRAYNQKERLWVYQYDNQLYFLINSESGSLRESVIKIPVLRYTSRVDLLPEEHKKNGYERLGSYYEDEYYRKVGVLPWQVVVVDLPTEYPVMSVNTGLYDNELKEWNLNLRIMMSSWRVFDFE